MVISPPFDIISLMTKPIVKPNFKSKYSQSVKNIDINKYVQKNKSYEFYLVLDLILIASKSF